MEITRPPGRTENQHSPDTNWKSNSHSPLPDKRVWLLLGHQPIQRSDRLQDSTGTVVRQKSNFKVSSKFLFRPTDKALTLVIDHPNALIPLVFLVRLSSVSLNDCMNLKNFHRLVRCVYFANHGCYKTFNLWSCVGDS